MARKACGCSQPSPAHAPGAKSTASIPVQTKQQAQHGFLRGRRRASGDSAAKLSPIDLNGSGDGLSGQESPPNAGARSVGSVESLGFGDETTHGGIHESAQGGQRSEGEGNGGRSSGVASGRQLDSIVDEARAEVRVFGL